MFTSVREGRCGFVNLSGYLCHQIPGFEGKCINTSRFFIWGEVNDLIVKTIYLIDVSK